ncbi:MAG: TerD family protein [Oscillospiraceae bacterium]
MNGTELQKLLNSPDMNGEVRLPQGEFEGNFTVGSPCKIFGNGTTLLSDKGTVLTVNAPDVEINDLQIELTNPRTGTAVCSACSGTSLNGVSVSGRIIGISGEEGYFGIPGVITIGKIPAEEHCCVCVRLELPTAARFVSYASGVNIVNSELSEGENTVRIEIEPMKSGTVLYGELAIETAVSRRIFISGEAVMNAFDYEDGKLVYESEPAPSEEEIGEPGIIYPEEEEESAEEVLLAPMPYEDEKPQQLLIIERGMLVKADAPSAQIELLYDNKDFPMEVDAFAFMTNSEGTVTQNDRFVFFGNDHSLGGGVKLLNAPDKKVFHINFDAIPQDVAEIDIAYSIYNNPLGLNFSDLSNPAVSIKLSDGTNYIFMLPKPLDVGTIVGLELMRDGDGFKLSPLGMIYPRGLEDLCRNYGLNILK